MFNNLFYRLGAKFLDESGLVKSYRRKLRGMRRALSVEELGIRISPALLGQQLFPTNYPLNQNIASAPVLANSNAINDDLLNFLHNNATPGVSGPYDGGVTAGGDYPINIVHGNSVTKTLVQDWHEYAGNYIAPVPVPIPPNVVVENEAYGQPGPGPGYDPVLQDNHLIIWDEDNNVEYDLYHTARPTEKWSDYNGIHLADGNWHASEVNIWHLNSYDFEPGATAAEIPLLPMLANPAEVPSAGQGGEGIDHALYLELDNTLMSQWAFLYPALASAHNFGTTSDLVPYGLRLRLKASVDISSLDPESQAIAIALKDYGAIMSDTEGGGAGMKIELGAYSVDANNDKTVDWDSAVNNFKIPISDFEWVDLSPKVTGLSESTGHEGDTITITGQNFSYASPITEVDGTTLNSLGLSVLFGQSAATSFTVVKDSTITAKVPTAPTGFGTVDVQVLSGVDDTSIPGGVGGNLDYPFFGYGLSPQYVTFSYGSGTIEGDPSVPAAPTNLTSTAGNNQVTLSWSPESGAISYYVYRGTIGAQENISSPIQVYGSSYTDTTAVNGTTYYYQIAAVNNNGPSALSNEVAAMPNPPAAVLDPSFESDNTTPDWINQGSTDLTGFSSYDWEPATYSIVTGTTYDFEPNWGASGNMAGDESNSPRNPSAVHINTIAGVWAPTLSTTDTWAANDNPFPNGGISGNQAAWVDGFTSGTSYNYIVQQSSQIFQPNTTYSLTVAVGARTDAFFGGYQIKLEYGSIDPVTGVLTGTVVDSTSSTTAPQAGGFGDITLSYTAPASGAMLGQHLLIVLATNPANNADHPIMNPAVDNSQEMPQTDFDNVRLAYVPSAPTGVAAVAGTAQVALSWSASVGAASYNIYRATISGAETLYDSGVTATSFTDTGLTNGTTYYYEVTAVNSGGSESVKSGEVPGTPVSASLPSGWSDQDIAGSTPAGSASYSSGTWTVTGGGNGIMGTADQFNFASETATGNVTFSAEMTSFSGTNYSAMAGLMLRNSSAANDLFVDLVYSPGWGALMQVRSSVGGNTSDPGYVGVSAPSSSQPLWLKLVQSGTTFTGYESANGTTWTTVASTTFAANASLLAGLAITSEYNYPLVSTTVTNVSVVGALAAPTGVTATPGVGEVTLSWAPVSGAASYNVYRSTSSGGEVFYLGGITTTSFIDSFGSPQSLYYYDVTAVDGSSNESAASSEVSGQYIPAAPTGITATNSVSAVTLTWSAVSGATSYNVYRGTSSGTETLFVGGITGTTFADIYSYPEYVCYYRVTAVNGSGGEGAPSSEVSGQYVPTAPTGVTATNGVGEITVNWTAVSGATSYNVYRGTSTGTETFFVGGITGTSFTDSYGYPEYVCYYEVTAVNTSGGEGAQSSEVSGQYVPTAPLGPTATAGNAQVVLSWSPLVGATSYNVYRATTSGGETLYHSGATATSYTDTSATNGTTYYYEVTAVNTSGGEGAKSSQVSATPLAASLPSGWSDQDVAGSTPAGSASYSSGTWTVTGGGNGIMGTADQFNFASEAVSGNVTFSAEMTSFSGTNYSAMAGLMLRNSSAANDLFVDLVYSPGWGALMQVRSSVGSNTSDPGYVGVSAPSSSQPLWLKLVQSGTTFTGYESADGTTWTTVGSTTFSASSSLLAGLAITSEYNYPLVSATIANVSVVGGPAAPTGVTATPGVGAVTVSWTAVSGATSYNVYRSTNSGGEVFFLAGITSTSFIDSFGYPQNLYYYKVTAVNSSNTEGPQSSEVSGQYLQVAVTVPTLGTLRSDFTGWLGFEFTTGSSALVVTDLGRWDVSGNSAAHTVELVDAATNAVVASVSINTAGAAAGQFNYGAMSGVTLQANHSYYLLTQETQGGDQWYDYDSSISSSSDLTVNGAVYSVDNANFYLDKTGRDSYGLVNFEYQL